MPRRLQFYKFVAIAGVCCSIYLFAQQYDRIPLASLPVTTTSLNNLTSTIITATTIIITLTPSQAIGDQILGDDSVRFVVQNASKNIDAKHSGIPKLIVLWKMWLSEGIMNACPDWNCMLTADWSLAAKADAILLGGADGALPPRRPDQYYVHFNQESPLHESPYLFYQNYFNMSLGYRRDAALPSPYGYTIKLTTPLSIAEVQLSDEQIKAKTKPIAWFVSNCATPSKREKYVSELKKYITVDTFGNCGNKNCPLGPECEATLRKYYRFYLALENSVCKDYITEKFWNQGFLDVVPIVLKRSIVENYAPPGSFIAFDDFKSPKDLAVHLKELMKNDTAYRNYFKWRTDYKVIFLNGKNHDYKERPWGFCRLCRLLWEQPRPIRVIENFNKWWKDDAQCEDGNITTKSFGNTD